jgi:hypothetical protein
MKPDVWIFRYRNNDKAATALSWDGPVSASYIPYVKKSSYDKLELGLQKIEETLNKLNESTPIEGILDLIKALKN